MKATARIIPNGVSTVFSITRHLVEHIRGNPQPFDPFRDRLRGIQRPQISPATKKPCLIRPEKISRSVLGNRFHPLV